MPNVEPVADGAAIPGWAPIIEDPALAALLRPGAVLHRLATGCHVGRGTRLDPARRVGRVERRRGQPGAPLGSRWAGLGAPGGRGVRERPHARSRRVGDCAARMAIGASNDWASTGRSRRSSIDYLGRRFNSPNDVVVKSDGTIWFTDPPYGITSNREGHQADSEIGDCLVFRFDPRTGELDAVTDWVDEPNGLAFSPDETVLYVSDTSHASHDDGGGNHHIAAFDVVDGRRLAHPRVFYAVDVWVPDGFRVDVEGNIWTSADDGIHVVAPDGRRLGRLPVPDGRRTASSVAPTSIACSSPRRRPST